MKQKLKQLTKIGILFFGISFFITNCQKENSPILEVETVQIEKPKSSIDFNTFLNKFGNQNNARIKTGSKIFSLDNYKFGYSSNISSRENEQSIVQYIDTTTIVAFEFDYIQTYTFEVVPTTESENTFYNIIFYQNEDGLQSKLLKYVCDFDCMNNNDIPFSGTVYEIEEDETVVNIYNTTDSSTNSVSRLITDCAFSTSTVSVNCSGDNHTFGDPTCLCGTPGHNCTPAYQYTVSDLVCITYNTGGGSNPDDGSSSGGGGTSTDDPNQNDDGTYNLPTDPVRGERATWTSFFNGLSPENQTLLNSNTIIRSQIQNFLLQNYYSNKAVSQSYLFVQLLNNDSNFTWTLFEDWFLNTPNYTEPDLNINPDNITYSEPLTQQELPALDDFVDNFPKLGTAGGYYEMPTSQVYQLVGGSLLTSHQNNPSAYSNACSIRGSRGLLYSGIDIPVLNYPNVGQRTQKGGDNKNYVLDAVSFDKFMRDKFGNAAYELTGADANDPIQVANLLSGKNGIYVIINNSHAQAGYSGHVDAIIDGDCISSAYTTPTGGVKSIRIWELN